MIQYLDKITPFFTNVTPFVNKIAPHVTQVVSKIGFAQLAQIAFVYKLYDNALANILALETNRHGTSIYSYAKIHLQGAKTSKGGHLQDQYQRHSKNRVFVFGDNKSLNDAIGTTICAIGYSHGAYLGLMPNFISNSRSKLVQIFFVVGAIFPALLTPTVKFRFTPEQLKKDFKVDEEGGALFTEKDVGISHLGIKGSLIKGLNISVFKRISNNPSKFVLGIAQIVAAVGLTCIYCGVVTSSPLINSSIIVVSEFMKNHLIIKNVAFGALYLSTL